MLFRLVEFDLGEELGLEDLLTITTSLFFLVLDLSSRFALLLLLPELLLVEEFLEFRVEEELLEREVLLLVDGEVVVLLFLLEVVVDFTFE